MQSCVFLASLWATGHESEICLKKINKYLKKILGYNFVLCFGHWTIAYKVLIIMKSSIRL